MNQGGKSAEAPKGKGPPVPEPEPDPDRPLTIQEKKLQLLAQFTKQIQSLMPRLADPKLDESKKNAVRQMIMQVKSKMASLSADEPKGALTASAIANFKTVTSANIDNRKGLLKFSGAEGLTVDMIQKFISSIVTCEVTVDEEQMIATFPSKMFADVVYKSRTNTPYTIEWVTEPVKNAGGSAPAAQEDSEMAKDTKD